MLAALSANVLLDAWDSSPALIAVTLGPEHVLVYQNRASVEMFGTREYGHPLRDTFAEVNPEVLIPMDQALAGGAVLEMSERIVGVRDRAGLEVVLRYVLAPFRSAGGATAGLVITAIDVTAATRAERAAGRAGFLTDLTDRLTTAGDAVAGLQALTDALVPELADVAAVYIVPTSVARGSLETETIPPQVITVAEHLTPLGPPPLPAPRQEPAPWEAAMRAGEPVLLPVDPASLPVLAPDPATAEWLTRASAHSVAVVPLVVAGDVTGVLLLMAAGDRPAFRQRDLSLLSDIAARAGGAIGRLSTQQDQRRVASQLQRALLPAAPPRLENFSIAARYVAGAPGAEVGGDWWDVNDLGDGRITVGIGDVAGRGVPAAAVMGQARAAMRTASTAQLPPAVVLDLLDAQLREVIETGRLDAPSTPQFATACYAVIEPVDRRLRIANAGHLPPLVRRGTNEVTAIPLPAGKPLGLLLGGFQEITVPFAPGDTMVMFTDGLVEIHDRDIDEGMALLAGALREHGGLESVERLADTLIEVMSRRPGYGGDDVALVVVRSL